MNEDELYLHQFEAVIEDVDAFLIQKISQNLIYSLMEIKKQSKRSISRSSSKLNDVHSIKSFNNNSRSSSNSFADFNSTSKGKNHKGDESYDLIQGQQSLNEIRRKGKKQKLYTQNIDSVNELFSNEERERPNNRIKTAFPHSQNDSNIQINNQFYPTKGKVPKLIGLVSSEQISDIEPYGQDSMTHNKKGSKQYSNSIIQQDDDDDSFEDIILNRLDLIQEKVNRMLESKKNSKRSNNVSRNQIINNHSILSNPNNGIRQKIHPLTKLANVQSNQYFASQNKNGSNFREGANNKTTYIVSPKAEIRENNEIIGYRRDNRIQSKINYTERLNNIVKKVDNMANNSQQMPHYERYSNPKRKMYYETSEITNQYRPTHNKYSNVPKQKRQIGTFHLDEQMKIDPKTIQQLPIRRINQSQSKRITEGQSKINNESQSQIDYDKIKQQQQNSQKGFKYIPMSKLNTSNDSGINTERRNKQLYIQQSNQYEEPLQSRYSQEGKGFNYSQQIQRKGKDNNNIHRKSNRTRSRNLQDSDVKAYTDNPNLQQSEDQLSANSQQNVYSESRRLKKVTERFGYEEKKQIKNNQYRYQQKTQRPKFASTKVQIQGREIEPLYRNQKLVQVRYIDSRDNYVERDHHIERNYNIERNHNEREHHEGDYVYVYKDNNYGDRGNIYPERNHAHEAPLYVNYSEQYVHEGSDSGPTFRDKQQFYVRNPIQNQIHSNDNRKYSLNNSTYIEQPKRKKSSGSMNSFKSIPYRMQTHNEQIRHSERPLHYANQQPSFYVNHNR